LSKKTDVHSRFTYPKPNIRSRLTFPPHSIHSHIIFLELTYAEATTATSSSLAAEKMVVVDRYMTGYPGQCLSQGHVAVVAGGAMMAELQKLCRKAVVLTTINSIPQVRATDVAYELHR
jgi:hypothetical protein